ncbi:MAG: SagB/ThcOx family dehydrogenase [Bacteroidia bacterium]|nr:SagB/ThcOx family dehydrogenase [Bacteroidia bacterium]
MKKTIFYICFTILSGSLFAQGLKTIVLNPPDLKRGLPVIEALSLRASASGYTGMKLSQQDLSDLLWAANGINRKETGKRTAPSAMNSQDIDVYLIAEDGAYLYDAVSHVLNPVVSGDHRSLAAGRQSDVAKASVILLLVSDFSKFKSGEDAQKSVWAAFDAGIVSQNICIFCSGVGFKTRTRGTMEVEKLKSVLHLKDSQHLMLNNPVSY